MLINCAAYENGRKQADISVAAISDTLEKTDGFVWVALKDATPEELAAMQEEFNLHELAIEDARNGHQRPKIEEYTNVLFCVMHLLEIDSQGELSVGELAVFIGSKFALSVRNRSGIDFLNVRARCEREPHLLSRGAGYVLYALMDTVVDRYFGIMHALESELEAIEERLFAPGSPTRLNVEDLYALKRKLVTVNHAVAPLLEAVAHLYGGRVPYACSGMQEYFRDVYDHLQLITKSIDTVRDMLGAAIQVNFTLIQLDESQVSKKLAGYAALFGVPTMIAGIYGMNFENMPELKIAAAYPLVITLMVVLDLILWWRFKKVGWL